MSGSVCSFFVLFCLSCYFFLFCFVLFLFNFVWVGVFVFFFFFLTLENCSTLTSLITYRLSLFFVFVSSFLIWLMYFV